MGIRWSPPSAGSVVALAVAAGLLATRAESHPGHGRGDGFGIIHYFIEPQHSLPILGIGALILLVFVVLVLMRVRRVRFSIRRPKRRRREPPQPTLAGRSPISGRG